MRMVAQCQTEAIQRTTTVPLASCVQDVFFQGRQLQLQINKSNTPCLLATHHIDTTAQSSSSSALSLICLMTKMEAATIR